MDEREKTDILQLLEQGSSAMLAALAGFDEAAAARRPGPERWSALECAEHVAVVEETLLRLVSSAEAAAEPTTGRGREALIVRVGADRSRRIDAPERVRPTGRYATLAEAVSAFQLARAETLRFVASCTEDLRGRSMDHPRLGRVTAQEGLLLLAMHPARHARQVAEIRAAL